MTNAQFLILVSAIYFSQALPKPICAFLGVMLAIAGMARWAS